MAEVDILKGAAILIEHPRFGRGCLFGIIKREKLANVHFRAYLVTEKRFVRINKQDLPHWISLRVLHDNGQCATISQADVLRMINENGGDDSSDDNSGDNSDDSSDDSSDEAVGAPVYDRPAMPRNVLRYAVGDVLRFVHPGWTHNPRINGRNKSREGVVTHAYTTAGDLAYVFRFNLLNGTRTTKHYNAKPSRQKQRKHDEAIDTSPYVIYQHS